LAGCVGALSRSSRLRELMQAKKPFIVIEGIDAAGSSTQTALLVDRLQRAGKTPLQLHFPQEDTKTGQLIYDKFLRTGKMGQLSRREQALLYIADFYSRADDIAAVLGGDSPYDMVVADRWATSTLAYQTMNLTGAKRTAMLDWLTWIMREGKPRLSWPDVVIFLDTPLAVAQKRLGKKKDFFEASLNKQRSIRTSYCRLADQYKWITVSSVDDEGDRTRQDISDEVWGIVRQLADDN